MKDFREECKEIIENQDNRSHIVAAIKDYNGLVHTRSRYNKFETSVFAVEETVQPFVEDAVKSTFGMVWTSAEKPFRIVHNDKLIKDDPDVIAFYEEVEVVLINELNNVRTGFTRALEQCLKNYFEYGCTFVQLKEVDEDKSFFCKAFNLCLAYPSFTETDKLDKLLITQEKQDIEILFKRKDLNKWTIHTLNKKNEISALQVNYTPVYYMTQTPDNEMRFAIGQGLAALPEIKQMDSIVYDLTEACAKLLKPVHYYVAGLFTSKGNSPIDDLDCGGREPVVIDAIPTDRIFPFGWAKIPSEVAPAIEILDRLIVKVREKFGFINRLFSIKATEQMTATEATIRTRADRNQTKHLQDMISGQLLSPLYESCLRILNGYKKLPKKPNIIKDMYNITFVHSSIYQETEDEKRLAQINNGLTLLGNIIQFTNATSQIPNAPRIDSRQLATEIANIMRLPPQQTGSADLDTLAALIRQFPTPSSANGEEQGMEQAAADDAAIEEDVLNG